MTNKFLLIPKRTSKEPKLPKELWRNQQLHDILKLYEKTKLCEVNSNEPNVIYYAINVKCEGSNVNNDNANVNTECYC